MIDVQQGAHLHSVCQSENLPQPTYRIASQWSAGTQGSEDELDGYVRKRKNANK